MQDTPLFRVNELPAAPVRGVAYAVPMDATRVIVYIVGKDGVPRPLVSHTESIPPPGVPTNYDPGDFNVSFENGLA